MLQKRTKTRSDILGVKTLFPLRWGLTVWYLSIICLPLYHASLKLQIILKVYCINLDDRSETWNYLEFIESRDKMALKLQSRTGKYTVWLFLLIISNATCNAENDHLAMCKID